jgi:hypothetical protein
MMVRFIIQLERIIYWRLRVSSYVLLSAQHWLCKHGAIGRISTLSM